jgi:hypothetical protein
MRPFFMELRHFDVHLTIGHVDSEWLLDGQ